MPNTAGVLDAVIGLVFLYLLLSVICSSINELFAAIFAIRSKTLKKSVESMLDDALLTKAGHVASAKFFEHPLIKNLPSKPSYIGSSTFVHVLLDVLHDHNETDERIKLLKQAVTALGDKQPSLKPALDEILSKHQSARNIADAIARLADKTKAEPEKEALTLLAEEWKTNTLKGVKELLATLPENSPLRRQLQTLVDHEVKTIDDYRARLGKWFDESMSRTSGVYKRKMQWVSVFIGLLCAFALGIDSLSIASGLMRNSALRETAAAAAIDYAKKHDEAPKSAPDAKMSDLTTTVSKSMEAVNELQLPIGWEYLEKTAAQVSAPERSRFWIFRLCGMFITGFAISLGAPFWYDMLNKLTSLRAAGPPPKEGDTKKT